MQELLFKNYDIKYTRLKYKNVSLFLQKINFLKLLKNKLEYFLLFLKCSTTILILGPQLGGYKSYNHGLIGIVGYLQIKFLFLKQKKSTFNLTKFLFKLVLATKLIYFHCLKIVFYFKFKVVAQPNGFILPTKTFIYKLLKLKGGNKIKVVLRKNIKNLEFQNLMFWREALMSKNFAL